MLRLARRLRWSRGAAPQAEGEAAAAAAELSGIAGAAAAAAGAPPSAWVFRAEVEEAMAEAIASFIDAPPSTDPSRALRGVCLSDDDPEPGVQRGV